MSKNITFGKEAIEKMMKGLDTAAEAVAGTIGPKGRNVYFETDLTPEITNDGATVANRVHLSDPQEDAGAYIIRNVTGQTNDDAGDGTTTTAVLTQAIIHEALKRPENPAEIKDSLNEAGQKVLKALAELSKPIKKTDVEQVAYISAENTEIAKMITEIVEKLGDKAVINVEDSKTFKTEYEIVDGYEASIGFMSPHFINDRKSGKAVYESIPVLVSEKKIQNILDISPIFEEFKKAGINQCVIVAEDIEDSMLGMFITNKNLGTFNTLIIRATGDVLKDIEGVTGAQRVSDQTGITFKSLKLEHLGEAKKIVCGPTKTLFLGNGEPSKKYADFLESTVGNEDNMYLKKALEQRIAKLKGGVATLRVAAPTDPERIYLRRKAEDAVKATLAALEEGVVAGGGMALWRLAQELEGVTIGEQILKKAMTAPLRRIIENCGKDFTEVITSMPKDPSEDIIVGYNAKDDTYVDMLENGILDPSKVTRCALENSISAGAIFITTFCLITDAKDKDGQNP